MMDCCTMIGDSLSKSDKNEPKDKQQNNNNTASENFTATPIKTKSSCKSGQDDSFIVKTSHQICSSVKKILSSNLQSLKKMVPKFLKSSHKNQKFTIVSLGETL